MAIRDILTWVKRLIPDLEEFIVYGGSGASMLHNRQLLSATGIS